MTCHIDQSNKVEQTEKDTVIALSNGVRLTILMRANDKRILQQVFRQRGEQRNFILYTFSLLVIHLFKHAKIAIPVRVDLEYKGGEGVILNRLTEYSKKLNFKLDKSLISFKSIGKGSPAHALAGKVTSGKQNPDFRLTAKEAMEIFFPKKKTGCSRCRNRRVFNGRTGYRAVDTHSDQ